MAQRDASPEGTAERAEETPRAQPGNAGFTLIELMVVIVLIGIAAAMIVPEMKGSYEDALLRSASRELVDAFQLAYSRAVSLNQAHRIRIEESSGRYVVEASSGRTSRGMEFRPIKELPGYAGEIDSRIQVRVRNPVEAEMDQESEADYGPTLTGVEQQTVEPGSLVFYGDGTADNREVWLKDRQGFGIVLSINPVTARVRITKLARE